MTELTDLSSYKKLTSLEDKYFLIQKSQRYYRNHVSELQQDLDRLSVEIHEAREEYKKDYNWKRKKHELVGESRVDWEIENLL